MHRKALALLVGLLALAMLGGCGGGGSSTSTSTSTSTGGAASAPRQKVEKAPEATPAAVERLKQRARDLRKVRERERELKSRTGGGKPAPPAPKPPIHHHDSGGGAAQFRTKGGDNSIQESGVEASAAERERAAAAFHAYLDFRSEHRWKDACSYLSASLIVGLERTLAIAPEAPNVKGCPKMLAGVSENVPRRLLKKLSEVDIGSLRLKGDRGFLLYHGPQGKDYVMLVVKEDGGWKMSGLDGTVLP